jgi:predicted transglutaminase-like cysteine proteinase
MSCSGACDRTRARVRRLTPARLIIAAVILLLSHGPLITPAKGQAERDLPRALPLLTSTEEIEPTPAWMRFCEQAPAECSLDPSEPEVISLTPDIWRTLVAVNERVNTAIQWMADRQHWGVEDRWDYPDDGYGDCEDIQLLKRKLLIEAGLPRRALRMTVVLDEVRAGHAVLMVRTDQGDFIVDNKRSSVLPWNETGYEFIKREGAGGHAWVAMSPQPASIVTARQPVGRQLALNSLSSRLREK